MDAEDLIDAQELVRSRRSAFGHGYALDETVWIPGVGPGRITRFSRGMQMGDPFVTVRVRTPQGELDLPLAEIQPAVPDLHDPAAVLRWLAR